MKNILIAGGTGFIGRYIRDKLKEQGFQISILARSKVQNTKCKYYVWDPEKGMIDKESLQNQHVIINLAGAGIADKLWTKKRREIILQSRIESTKLLIDSLKELNKYPNLFINASAIGFYGHRPGEILTEKSLKGSGFLSRVCYEWEKALTPLTKLNIPYAIIRLGIVLGRGGGSLLKLLFPLQHRINVIFGSGKQCVPWIHIEDVFQIVSQLTEGKLLPGIYNGVAPDYVSQAQLNRTILKYLYKKPITIRISSGFLSSLIGEMASVFISEQQIKPLRLIEQKFRFNHPLLEDAMKDLLTN